LHSAVNYLMWSQTAVTTMSTDGKTDTGSDRHALTHILCNAMHFSVQTINTNNLWLTSECPMDSMPSCTMHFLRCQTLRMRPSLRFSRYPVFS